MHCGCLRLLPLEISEPTISEQFKSGETELNKWHLKIVTTNGKITLKLQLAEYSRWLVMSGDLHYRYNFTPKRKLLPTEKSARLVKVKIDVHSSNNLLRWTKLCAFNYFDITFLQPLPSLSCSYHSTTAIINFLGSSWTIDDMENVIDSIMHGTNDCSHDIFTKMSEHDPAQSHRFRK